MIREPEATGSIEDNVVWTAQRLPVAMCVEHFNGARLDIDAFDATADVVGGLLARIEASVALDPFEAAVVTDVTVSVGSNRRSKLRSSKVRS